MSLKPFHFKKFTIAQDRCAMKIGTDGVLLGAWCDVSTATNALDIGTGSGCIAISLAKNLQNAETHALDVSQEALKVAAFNAKTNNVTIECIEADILILVLHQ